jgi:hypothetical protein
MFPLLENHDHGSEKLFLLSWQVIAAQSFLIPLAQVLHQSSPILEILLGLIRCFRLREF